MCQGIGIHVRVSFGMHVCSFVAYLGIFYHYHHYILARLYRYTYYEFQELTYLFFIYHYTDYLYYYIASSLGDIHTSTTIYIQYGRGFFTYHSLYGLITYYYIFTIVVSVVFLE